MGHNVHPDLYTFWTLALIETVREYDPEMTEEIELAWRMVIELCAGLGIGFGIGYSLDWFLGTLPIFMVLFVMLGLAAGVKTMLRSAQEIQEKKMADVADEEKGP